MNDRTTSPHHRLLLAAFSISDSQRFRILAFRIRPLRPVSQWAGRAFSRMAPPESQRDSILQPTGCEARATLGSDRQKGFQPQSGVNPAWRVGGQIAMELTPIPACRTFGRLLWARMSQCVICSKPPRGSGERRIRPRFVFNLQPDGAVGHEAGESCKISLLINGVACVIAGFEALGFSGLPQ